jgi:integrase
MRKHPNHSSRATGYVYPHEGKRGRVWRAKFRLPDGTRKHTTLGPAGPKNGRPPEGTYTKRTAEAELRRILTAAERGELPSQATKSGATVADAVEEWLRYCEHERSCAVSTLYDYRSGVEKHVLPALGDLPLEAVTPEKVELLKRKLRDSGLTPRTVNKTLTYLHGVFERARKVYGLTSNPVADVEKLRTRFDHAAYDFYSPEEVHALVRAALNRGAEEDDCLELDSGLAAQQDGAIYLTAAFTGLRMGELLALRWRDVDFENETIRVERAYTYGALKTPKSGKVRSVPMIEDVARALSDLSLRDEFTEPDDLVFPGLRRWAPGVADAEGVTEGRFLDGSALRRRFRKDQKAAGLRPLRFHDLRHTFASLAIQDEETSPRDLQEWMGHASFQTTERYMHHRSKAGVAKRLGRAFRTELPEPLETLTEAT